MVIDSETADMIAALQSRLSSRALGMDTKPSKVDIVRSAVAQAHDAILAASEVKSKIPSSNVCKSVRVDKETAASILAIQDALSVKVKRKWHLRRGETITAGRPKKSEVIKDAVTMLLERHGG